MPGLSLGGKKFSSTLAEADLKLQGFVDVLQEFYRVTESFVYMYKQALIIFSPGGEIPQISSIFQMAS